MFYTYSSHPIACAVADRVLAIMEREHLVERAAEVGARLGAQLKEELSGHPMVGDIRGTGMFWGVEMVRDRDSRTPYRAGDEGGEAGLVAAGLKRGLFVYPATGMAGPAGGDAMMVTPPFVIGRRRDRVHREHRARDARRRATEPVALRRGTPSVRGETGSMADSIIGPTSHYFYSQRLKLHYVDWGNADKPLLILVHGGRDHCRNWDWVALELRRHFHLIAPDLRGHGDSDWAIGGSYAMIDHVLDLCQLMNAIAGEPVDADRPFAGRGRRAAVRRRIPDSVKARGRDRGPGTALRDAA